MKHTPGPRLIEESIEHGVEIYVEGTDECSIATVYSAFGEGDFNAHLIAAAPELLQESKNVILWLKSFVGDEAWSEIVGDNLDNRPVECIKQLIQAIEKAEGK